jgi:hypothetical protein
MYLCQGIGRMLCGLKLPSLLGVQCASVNPHCAHPSAYFDHRFAPLRAVIFPPPLSYAQFAEAVKAESDTMRESMLVHAERFFALASKELRDLLVSPTPELCPLPEHLIRAALKVRCGVWSMVGWCWSWLVWVLWYICGVTLFDGGGVCFHRVGTSSLLRLFIGVVHVQTCLLGTHTSSFSPHHLGSTSHTHTHTHIYPV